MKKTIGWLAMACIISILCWQCSKDETSAPSLKGSLSKSAKQLNTAVNSIVQTAGYKILQLDDTQLKSTWEDDMSYTDSILLKEISGIYEYNAQAPDHQYDMFYRNVFLKTGESDSLIIQLPEEKVFKPWRLRMCAPDDTGLVNNFVITASEYHYYFSQGFIHDYKLLAGFRLDEENIGSLEVESSKDSWLDYNLSTAYTFENNYKVNVFAVTGDTSAWGFSLTEEEDTLLMEKVVLTKSDQWRHLEKEYILVIGNVEFRRVSGSHDLEIYVNGVLQENVVIEVIDTSDENETGKCICRNRDIRITFDDGTVTTISELIGPSREILNGLVVSMRDMYFASRIIDYIAWKIYRTEIIG